GEAGRGPHLLDGEADHRRRRLGRDRSDVVDALAHLAGAYARNRRVRRVRRAVELESNRPAEARDRARPSLRAPHVVQPWLDDRLARARRVDAREDVVVAEHVLATAGILHERAERAARARDLRDVAAVQPPHGGDAPARGPERDRTWETVVLVALLRPRHGREDEHGEAGCEAGALHREGSGPI